MATLEDKILGNKLHNYCSSSEESDGNESDSEESKKTSSVPTEPQPTPDINKWEGTSTNTGPKGVIKDWQKYKQLKDEKRIEDERQKVELMKKLTLTVQTALDEEKEKAALDDPELNDLLNDEFLLNYQKQRIEEMLEQTNHKIKFGNLLILQNSQEFLDAIDKEHKSVKIIVHIYEDKVEACRTMNACLTDLCKIYNNVKFCAISSSLAGMSKQFKTDGVPALLIYKAGQLVGNFVRLSDEFGNEFLPEDVQSYLVEHGILEDKKCTPYLIKNDNNGDDSSDTD